jgi:hypothetical protein
VVCGRNEFFSTFRGNKMKKTAIALAVASALASPAFAASFVNGGFEDGEPPVGLLVVVMQTFLRVHQLRQYRIECAAWLPGGVHYNAANSNSAIINTSPMSTPVWAGCWGQLSMAGNSSYRVENTTNGGYASAISQSVLELHRTDIFFAWKAVLQNGGHVERAVCCDEVLTLRDDTTNTTLITRTYNAGAVRWCG